MMKRIILLFVGAASLVACKQSEKKNTFSTDSTYTVSGKISGNANGYVYLAKPVADSMSIDSVKIENGTFKFTGKIKEPEFFQLGINRKFVLGFMADNGDMVIEGSADSLAKAKVTGSEAQKEYEGFLSKTKSIEKKVAELYKKYADADKNGTIKEVGPALDKEYEDMNKEFTGILKLYLKDNKNSAVSAFLLFRQTGGEMDKDYIDIFNSFGPDAKNSSYGKQLQAAADVGKKTEVGVQAIDFTMNDTNGKPIALSSFKGKYLLVDFWASWCGPCRQENPNVVKAYQQFKGKGFDILGVSLDTKKDDWMHAITADNLTWNHVSDLQGWKNAAAVQYGIKGIPANLLLDKTGKIIAKNLRGEDLEKKLAEVMK